MALRSAIGFWLSDRERRDHLHLLNDAFETMRWAETADQVTLLGRGLDFRLAEAQLKEHSLTSSAPMIPFIVMIRAPVRHEALTLWTQRLLTVLIHSTSWTALEETTREHRSAAQPKIFINGIAADVNISIPITVLSKDIPSNQLGQAETPCSAAMSIFQPHLEKTENVLIAKVLLARIYYETAHVVVYKTTGTFIIVIDGPSYHTCVSLILKGHPNELRCNWSDKAQVFMRVVSNIGAGLKIEDHGRSD